MVVELNRNGARDTILLEDQIDEMMAGLPTAMILREDLVRQIRLRSDAS